MTRLTPTLAPGSSGSPPTSCAATTATRCGAVGRRGDAIAWVRERGFGRRWIFDPRTSRILAQAEMIFGPPSTDENGVPPETAFRESAYLQTGIEVFRFGPSGG